MTRLLAFLLAIRATAAATQPGLFVRTWPNAGFGGPAADNSTIPTFADVAFPPASQVFSLDFQGSLVVPTTGQWNVSCDAQGGAFFLWLNDHLVCQSGNDPNTWGAYRGESVIPFAGPSERDARPASGQLPGTYFARATFAHPKPTATTAPPSIKVYWQQQKSGADPRALIPASAFVLDVPRAQRTRLAVQRGLLHGRWSTWEKGSVSAHALLPHGVVLQIGLCQISGNTCQEDGTKSMIDGDQIRLGPHAHDHSYTQLFFAAKGFNVSIETSQLGGVAGADFVALVTGAAVQAKGTNASDFAVVLIARMADDTLAGARWRLPGNVSVDRAAPGGAIVATPAGRGLAPVAVRGAKGLAPMQQPLDVRAPDYLLWQFGSGAGVAFSATATASPQRSLDEIAALVKKARAAELARYAAYGDLAEMKEASQSAMMWNFLFCPELPGPFAPVSRGWGNPWVIFDWDNIFGAYQLGLDAPALAYSQLAGVIKTKTAAGMVPNFWQPGGISYDRTEPMVGAKVLHELFAKNGDTWIVELLYGDLFDWADWFFRKRRLAPLGLIALGSTPGLPTTDVTNMQAARYESGLDNSPMYDGEFFNATGKDLMDLYDVGMSSMVAMELQALANLSVTAFDPPRTDDHALLTARLEELAGLIRDHLWDDASGAFVNKFSGNASFYRRVSPTSFYPLLARVASDDQARAMATGWLMNSSRFCIDPNGDVANNPASCWWGLPSINAADPAYPPLGYWRGFTWGPMAQLTYWALQQYDHVPAVRQGRRALATQMKGMLTNQWRRHHHICENFSPHSPALRAKNGEGDDCTGDHFYHWGALAGLLSIIEAGFYN